MFEEACDQAMRKLVPNLRLPFPSRSRFGDMPRGRQSNVFFMMNDEKNAYKLYVSYAMKRKFVTINDDIEDHDGYFPKRLKILHNCLFPEACAYEKEEHRDSRKRDSINCDSLRDPKFPGPSNSLRDHKFPGSSIRRKNQSSWGGLRNHKLKAQNAKIEKQARIGLLQLEKRK